MINSARAYAGEAVGLTYGVKATVQTGYLWRGLNAGAMNMQASADVGYGGLYFNAWWNIGTLDWTFRHFQPEVDLTLGFSRWGVDVSAILIHNFNCGLFDFTNHPDGGNALEVDLRYTVSDRIPLSILWGTRVTASDGYMRGNDTIRAYSTYIEISYTQRLRDGFSLYGAIGMTPWRSLYTHYQGAFAVHNIDLRVRKDWDVSAHCGMMVQGQLMINPVAATEMIIPNLGLGVYLK